MLTCSLLSIRLPAIIYIPMLILNALISIYSHIAGEPQLATAFFNMVRGWVVELRALVHTTQEVNKASMNQVTDNMTRVDYGFCVFLWNVVTFSKGNDIDVVQYIGCCNDAVSYPTPSHPAHNFLSFLISFFLYFSLSYSIVSYPNNTISNTNTYTCTYILFMYILKHTQIQMIVEQSTIGLQVRARSNT